MSPYSIVNIIKDERSQSVGANKSNEPVTPEFQISAEDSKNLLVRLRVSSVTAADSISAKLQSSWDSGNTWKDHGNVAISTDGTVEIEHDHSEANTGCLYPLARVVVSTGNGDTVTVDAVYVTRR